MATPTVLVNNSTGSDTLASGAGPATALNGAGAALASTTSVDLSVDAPNLSGVATDGSAVLWVGSTAGIQASIITAVNNGTKVVTVTTAFSVTQSGKNWAIGGKRSTLDNATTRTILANLIVENTLDVSIAYTGSDYTLSSVLSIISGNNQILTFTGTGATRPIIRQTAAASCIQATYAGNPGANLNLNFLQITNSHASHGDGVNLNSGNVDFFASNCIFGDATNQLTIGISAPSNYAGTVIMKGCVVKNCTSDGINANGFVFVELVGCSIRNNGGAGVVGPGQSRGDMCILNTIINNNTSYGITSSQNNAGGVRIYNSTIDSNGGHGFYLPNNPDVNAGDLVNNNFTNNTGYGAISGGSLFGLVAEGNNYYNNSSGARSNVITGPTDVAVNPTYVGGGDFTPTNVASRVGYPQSFA